MGELKTVDGYIADGDYVMAGLLTEVSFRQFREDWKSWKPNPNLSPAENRASDAKVARDYCHAGHKAIRLLFDIAKKTGDELDMDITLEVLTKFEDDIMASKVLLDDLVRTGKGVWAYPSGARVWIYDFGISDFAHYSLLPNDPNNLKLRKFVAQAYIHEGHLDGALHVTDGTPLQAETEKLVLELAQRLPR